jgi:hypothetical protein
MNKEYYAVEIRDNITGKTKLIKVPKIGVEIIEYFQDNNYISDEYYTINITELNYFFDEEFDLDDN